MIKELKIADYVTLLNLVCGSVSIYLAFKGFIYYAAVFIIIGAIFDKLDGIVARKLNQVSDLGAELDSFSDIVTFGLAPAALISNFYNIEWLTYIVILLPICGALRLARFNINRKLSPNYFIGVPITVNGVIFPLLIVLKTNYIIISLLVVIMAFLMISNIKIRKVF